MKALRVRDKRRALFVGIVLSISLGLFLREPCLFETHISPTAVFLEAETCGDRAETGTLGTTSRFASDPAIRARGLSSSKEKDVQNRTAAWFVLSV